MKNIRHILPLAAVALFVASCSQSSREETIDRVSDAAKALNGKSDDTPTIVKAEQKRERVRQDITWTAENQRKYPLEYCRAMLEELDQKESSLEVILHKVLASEASLRRESSTLESDKKTFSSFLEKAKAAYKSADEKDSWPTSFNGRKLSKEEFQRKIVEADRKLKAAESKLPGVVDKLSVLSKKKAQIAKEQGEVQVLRDRFQTTIRDIELKKLTDENGGLGQSLGSLADSLNALDQSSAVGSDDDFFSVSPDDELQSDFDAIMGE